MKIWIFAGAVAAAAIGGSASAEPPIGSRLGERLEKKKVVDERDGVQAARQLAGCIVVKRGSAARDLLAARTEEEVEKLRSRVAGEYACMAVIPRNALVEGVRISYPHDIMRGHLAEQLLQRNRPGSSQLQPLPIQKTYSRSWFAFTGRHISLDEMAACVADTSPAAVMALVGSEPFSGGEDAAFGSLMPAMGQCLVAGTKLDAKREPLRAALAEALYQRVTNPNESLAASLQTVAEVPKEQ